jgi:hypothetical protein
VTNRPQRRTAWREGRNPGRRLRIKRGGREISRSSRPSPTAPLAIWARPSPTSRTEGIGFPAIRSTVASRNCSEGGSRPREWSSARYSSRISCRLLPAAARLAAWNASLRAWATCSCRSRISRKSGGSAPVSAIRCRARSPPGQVHESRQTLNGTAMRRVPPSTHSAWHQQRHRTMPNSRRIRRGLNPPPMPTKCGQSLCASRVHIKDRGVWSNSVQESGMGG